jgi:hypothetical protein
MHIKDVVTGIQTMKKQLSRLIHVPCDTMNVITV